MFVGLWDKVTRLNHQAVQILGLPRKLILVTQTWEIESTVQSQVSQPKAAQWAMELQDQQVLPKSDQTVQVRATKRLWAIQTRAMLMELRGPIAWLSKAFLVKVSRLIIINLDMGATKGAGNASNSASTTTNNTTSGANQNMMRGGLNPALRGYSPSKPYWK